MLQFFPSWICSSAARTHGDWFHQGCDCSFADRCFWRSCDATDQEEDDLVQILVEELGQEKNQSEFRENDFCE